MDETSTFGDLLVYYCLACSEDVVVDKFLEMFWYLGLFGREGLAVGRKLEDVGFALNGLKILCT